MDESRRVKFSAAYTEFLRYHASRRSGERLRRLREGHGHAERLFLQNVWWPAFEHFEHLHPEYEVADFRDGHRFLDFAFIHPAVRLAIEVDGYGPHVAQLSRRQFEDQLVRQNHLVIDGWEVLRFPYDMVERAPRQCQQMVQQFMGRRLGAPGSGELSVYGEAVVRLAQTASRPITPGEVRALLRVGKRKARELLRELVREGWLKPAGGRERIRSYAPGAKRLR